MKDRIFRLERLKGITSLLADQAHAPVSEAGARVRNAEVKADALKAHRQDLMQSGNDPVLTATMLGQAERLRVLHAAALRDVAAARATFEAEKAKAAKAIGQDLVVDRLIEEQKAALHLEQKRRKLR